MGSTFFGLTSNTAPLVRKQLFKTIHNIVFHGNGGYDYHTIYDMPIWLRKFTFQEIQNHFDDTRKQNEEAMERSKNHGKKSLENKDGKVNVPAFTEASKQYKGKTRYK